MAAILSRPQCVNNGSGVVALRHQAITWINVELSPTRFGDIQPRAISQEIRQSSVNKISLRIADQTLHSNPQGWWFNLDVHTPPGSSCTCCMSCLGFHTITRTCSTYEVVENIKPLKLCDRPRFLFRDEGACILLENVTGYVWIYVEHLVNTFAKPAFLFSKCTTTPWPLRLFHFFA